MIIMICWLPSRRPGGVQGVLGCLRVRRDGTGVDAERMWGRVERVDGGEGARAVYAVLLLQLLR